MSPTQPGFVVIQEAPEGLVTPLRRNETVQFTCPPVRGQSRRFSIFTRGTLPFSLLKEPIDRLG